MTPTTATDVSKRIGLSFAPFIMTDDGCEGTDEEWIGYHCLLYSLKDAVDDLRYFDRHRHELRELLAQSGFHAVARLRKQTGYHFYTDEEFDTMLEQLAEAGYSDIALKADSIREWQARMEKNFARKTSVEVKRQLLAKLERLATSSNANESASALARAEEVKAKYELTSSDPFDFDLADLDAPLQLNPLAEFVIELQAIWTKLKPLGDTYYDLEADPERYRERLRERAHRLDQLVHEHRLIKRPQPIVQRRWP